MPALMLLMLRFPMAIRPTTLRNLYIAELPNLYAFVYGMCGDRADSFRFLFEVSRLANGHTKELLEAPIPADAILGFVARNLEKELGRHAVLSFQILDNVLRSDLTREIDMSMPGIDNDLSRIPGLLWELKRTCLTAVMGCLPPSVRLSFLLTDILGYSPPDAADLLEIKESAYRVRLTRARKRIEDYLAPRCFHVDRNNPCTCEGRLGIALDARFVTPPPHDLDTPQISHDSESPRRDMADLYRSLPSVLLSEQEIATILEVITH